MKPEHLTYSELKEVVRFIESEYMRVEQPGCVDGDFDKLQATLADIEEKAAWLRKAGNDLIFAINHVENQRNSRRRGAPRKLIRPEAKGIATDAAKSATETTVGR